jgi:hypothetical protein
MKANVDKGVSISQIYMVKQAAPDYDQFHIQTDQRDEQTPMETVSINKHLRGRAPDGLPIRDPWVGTRVKAHPIVSFTPCIHHRCT